MIHRILALSSALLLAAPQTSAQRTWIVDSDGAGDFTRVSDAVAAAQPGDTVIVERDPFTSSVTIDKGIRLLPPTVSFLDVTVRGLPAPQTFTLWGGAGEFDLTFEDCVGQIHVERAISLWRSPVFAVLPMTTTITNCALVTFTDSCVEGVTIANSKVQMRSGIVYGVSDSTSTEPAITAVDSDVFLALGRLLATSDTTPVAAVPAIDMTGGRLRIAGPVWVGSGAGPAIVSNGGEVILDPDASLSSGPGVPSTVGTSTFFFESIPYVARSSGDPELSGAPGASAFVLVSLPGAPFDTPFGEFWLDATPGFAVVIASGVTDSTGRFAIPGSFANPLPPGAPFVLQGVVVDGSGIRLTAPDVGVTGLPGR